ncbi:MAG: hypothetical protein JWM90_2359 [Thermoleophilia bacterium]|nr:hypothetical protein [Thermoleophilia bacterium]
MPLSAGTIGESRAGKHPATVVGSDASKGRHLGPTTARKNSPRCCRPGVKFDGTRLNAHAAMGKAMSNGGIRRKLREEAERIDADQDELYGDSQGNELPTHLREPKERIERLKRATRALMPALDLIRLADLAVGTFHNDFKNLRSRAQTSEVLNDRSTRLQRLHLHRICHNHSMADLSLPHCTHDEPPEAHGSGTLRCTRRDHP